MTPMLEIKAKVAAVIVAAGSGSRFGGEKQLLELGGKPMYRQVVDTFRSISAIDSLILVCSEALMEAADDPGIHKVLGGTSRQESVHHGVLMAEELGCEFVLVHDAARALLSAELIEQVLNETVTHGAAILALPVVDTIKEVADEQILRTVSRAKLWRAQTPQGGRVADLMKAFERSEGASFTDESELLESIGIQPKIVLGSEENFKITFPEDLERAEHILALRSSSK